MILSACPELHRTVYACPRVPAGIRLIGVAGNDLYHILTLNSAVQRDIEIRVAVGPLSDFLPVQKDFSTAVHALELKNILFAQIQGKLLCVAVIRTFEPAAVQPGCRGSRTLLTQHGVVGNGDGYGRLIRVQMPAVPAVIERYFSHVPVSLISVVILLYLVFKVCSAYCHVSVTVSSPFLMRI